MDRSSYPTRRVTMGVAEPAGDESRLTPGERVAMVWELTRQARVVRRRRWRGRAIWRTSTICSTADRSGRTKKATLAGRLSTAAALPQHS